MEGLTGGEEAGEEVVAAKEKEEEGKMWDEGKMPGRLKKERWRRREGV